MVDQAFNAMSEVVMQLDPVQGSIESNRVFPVLTPPSIVWAATIGMGPPRCEFEVGAEPRPRPGRKLYEAHLLVGRPQKPSGNIYQGVLRFPEFCCKCMEPVTHYEIVELQQRRGSGTSKLTFPGVSEKDRRRILHAVFFDRYWYTIPFCAEHGLHSQALTFKQVEPSGKIKIQFTNQGYGRLFGKLVY